MGGLKLDPGFGKPHLKEGQIGDLKYKEIVSIYISNIKTVFNPIDSFVSKFSNIEDSYVLQSALSSRLVNMVGTIFKLKKNEKIEPEEEKLLEFPDTNFVNSESPVFKFYNKLKLNFSIRILRRILDDEFAVFIHSIEKKRAQALLEHKRLLKLDFERKLIDLQNYNSQNSEIIKYQLLLDMIKRDNLNVEIKSLKVAFEEEIDSHDNKMQSYKNMKIAALQDYADEMKSIDIIVDGKKLDITEQEKIDLFKGLGLIKIASHNELKAFIADQQNGNAAKVNGTTFKSYQLEAGKKRISDNEKNASINFIMKRFNVDQEEAKGIYASCEGDPKSKPTEQKLLNTYKLVDKEMAKEIVNHTKRINELQSEMQSKQEQLKKLEKRIEHNKNELPASEIEEINTLLKDRNNNEDITKSSEAYLEFQEQEEEESIECIMDDLGIDNLDDLDLGEIKLDDLEFTNEGVKINQIRLNNEVDAKSPTPSPRKI